MKLVVNADELLGYVLPKIQEIFPQVTLDSLSWGGTAGNPVVVCDVPSNVNTTTKKRRGPAPKKTHEEPVEEAPKPSDDALEAPFETEEEAEEAAPFDMPEPTKVSFNLKPKEQEPEEEPKPAKSLFASLAKK